MFKFYLPSITFAARLAHQGLLGSVRRMKLAHDLTSVPDNQLASLVSSLQCGGVSSLEIRSVRGCDLVTILDSVKNPIWELTIRTQSLGSEETQALVRAVESRVEELWLREGVTLNIEALNEYSEGKCRVFQCCGDTAERYEEQLRTWATNRNWSFGVNESCQDSSLKISMYMSPAKSDTL